MSRSPEISQCSTVQREMVSGNRPWRFERGSSPGGDLMLGGGSRSAWPSGESLGTAEPRWRSAGRWSASSTWQYFQLTESSSGHDSILNHCSYLDDGKGEGVSTGRWPITHTNKALRPLSNPWRKRGKRERILKTVSF